MLATLRHFLNFTPAKWHGGLEKSGLITSGVKCEDFVTLTDL